MAHQELFAIPNEVVHGIQDQRFRLSLARAGVPRRQFLVYARQNLGPQGEGHVICGMTEQSSTGPVSYETGSKQLRCYEIW